MVLNESAMLPTFLVRVSSAGKLSGRRGLENGHRFKPAWTTSKGEPRLPLFRKGGTSQCMLLSGTMFLRL